MESLPEWSTRKTPEWSLLEWSIRKTPKWSLPEWSIKKRKIEKDSKMEPPERSMYLFMKRVV